MAIRFMDGFDCYADRAECMSAGWAPEDSLSAFSTTLGKNGGGCLLPGATSSNRSWTIGFPRIALGDTLIIAFWIRFGSLPAGTDNFIGIHTDGQMVAEMMITNAGELRVDTGNGVDHGTLSGTVISIETWYWFELKMLFGSGDTDGSYELRVNGSTITSQTGLDTWDNGELVNHIMFESGDSADVRVDDVIIMDDSGSDFNNFIGESYIETLTVDADGGTIAWTRNTGATDISAVDDADAAADDDTTYVASQTATEESRFGLPVPTITADTVKAVQIKARMRKEDAGVRTIRGLMNVNGGTEEILFDEVGLTTSYGWLSLGIRETNDTGGTPWDTTNVGLTEIGVEVVV